MSKENLESSQPDWEKLPWQETPYPGVFISLLREEPSPKNPKVPLLTLMAVRVDSGCSIPLHRHNRELSWGEELTFPPGSNFEIYRIRSFKRISNATSLTFTITAGEAFGLKNNGQRPLFFSSEMKPGFTGYEEIEEIN